MIENIVYVLFNVRNAARFFLYFSASLIKHCLINHHQLTKNVSFDPFDIREEGTKSDFVISSRIIPQQNRKILTCFFLRVLTDTIYNFCEYIKWPWWTFST